MKEKILKLRSEGKNYNQIVEILGCSKGTVSYHCGEGQKEKTLDRQKINRLTVKSKLYSKLNFFTRNKVRNFKRGRPNLLTDSELDYEVAFTKISNNPSCYLSGRSIDLTVSSDYQLDHIIPFSKGGENSLKNLGLTCKAANMAKSNLSVKEFIELCKDVLEHNGYKVDKELNIKNC